MPSYRLAIYETFAWQQPVLKEITSTSQAVATAGNRYLIGSGADATLVGASYGAVGDIVTYYGSDWTNTNSIYDTPSEGWVVYNLDTDVKLKYGSGSGYQWAADSSALDEKVKFDAGDSTAGYLADKIDGSTIVETSGGDQIEVDVTNIIDTAAGLTEASNEIQVNLDTDSFAFATGAIALAANVAGDGLDLASGQLSVDVTDVIDTNYGLTEDTNNVRVNLESDGGLQFDASNYGIEIKPDATTGATVAPLTVGANGAGVTVDNDTITHAGGTLAVGSDSIGAAEIDETDDYTLTGTVDMSEATAVSVPAPASGSHAATKDYVDTAINGVIWQDSVIDIATSTSPPPTEVAGDRYLLDASGAPHGDWDGAGQNDIVEFNGTSWVVTYNASVELEGGAVYDKQSETQYVHTTSGWSQLASSSNHNSLTSLQGGTSNEYYHLTSADYTKYTSVTSSATELNLLDGVTTTTAQLNYLNTATSDIQTQIDGKADSGQDHDADYVSIVTGHTTGNIATLTAGGEIQDSGSAISDLATSGHNHDADYISIIGSPTDGGMAIVGSGGELTSSAKLVANVLDSANNDLDDLPDGTQFQRVSADEVNANGHVTRLNDDTNQVTAAEGKTAYDRRAQLDNDLNTLVITIA
jgi:hypothetical protein